MMVRMMMSGNFNQEHEHACPLARTCTFRLLSLLWPRCAGKYCPEQLGTLSVIDMNPSS